MLTRKMSVISSVVFISVLICSFGFAQTPPHGITIHPDLEYRTDESKLVNDQVLHQFDFVMGQLDALLLAPDTTDTQKEQIAKVQLLLEQKKASLGEIFVYFLKTDATADFEILKEFYKDIALDDVVLKAGQAANERKSTDLAGALSMVPDNLLASDVKSALTTLIEDPNEPLKVAAGSTDKARMSISTYFVEPNADNPSNPKVTLQTVVIIAIK
jgi:hypothetical protein